VAQKAKKEKKRGKNKKKEEENEEYLVAPMPVWKRSSGDYGVDKELVADWERVKRSNGTVGRQRQQSCHSALISPTA
jgi:hypothetical protein